MKTNYRFGKAGIVTVLLASLTGCTTYVVQRPEPQRAYVPPPPPAPVIVQQAPPPEPAPVVVDQTPPPAVVVIQQPDDFVQPLSPYGEWITVGAYGRCWRPARVETGWRPYANGHWELTPDGWYWVSDEPWAWATYHYGRWQLAAGYGWVWVPETVWGPAWVSWREGGGYVGWAPLPPEPRGGVSVSVTIAPASFCFVDERRMRDPVRPTTVIVNNTTIINKTVNITKTRVVNKVVINDGPRADEVERVSGKKIQRVSIADLRKQEEEPVAEKHANLRARPDHGQQVQPKPEVKQPGNIPLQDQQKQQQMERQQREQQQQLQRQQQQKEQQQKQQQLREQQQKEQQQQQVERQQRQQQQPQARPAEKPAEQKAPEANNRGGQPNPLQQKQQQQQQERQQQQQERQQQRQQQKQEAQPAQNAPRERAVAPKQQNENNPRNARAVDRRNGQNEGTNNPGQGPR